MKKIFFILIVLITISKIHLRAQTALFLEITSGYPQHFGWTQWIFNPNEQKIQRCFWGFEFICEGREIAFECEDRQTKVQTIPLSSLGNYSFYTISQLNNLLLPKTHAEQEVFFSSFNKTYLIEINQANQTADIIEVRWDVIDM